MLIIAGILLSYLIGSVPTAYIFVRLLKGVDIRTVGSGNVGATNAMRVIGRGPGILVLGLDIIKGILPTVFIADYLVGRQAGVSPEIVRIALGLACLAGHNWTIFLGFKGGKGIATSLGVLIGLAVRTGGLAPVLGLTLAVWLAFFVITRIVSISSLCAAGSLPVWMVIFKQPASLTIAAFILAAVVVARHRANIERLLSGKEKRLF